MRTEEGGRGGGRREGGREGGGREGGRVGGRVGGREGGRGGGGGGGRERRGEENKCQASSHTSAFAVQKGDLILDSHSTQSE